MRKQWVDLVWRDEQGVTHQARLKPVGLQTREGQEFLLLQQDPQLPGSIEIVRLDHIASMK